MKMSPPKQRSLASFFSSNATATHGPVVKKPRRSIDGSHFGECPMCSKSLPMHQLTLHASTCNGPPKTPVQNSLSSLSDATSEPLPGLFLFENFITEEEEAQILAELDGKNKTLQQEFLPWKPSKFNGTHLGKRWGVHCNLRDRRVNAAENPLPHFYQTIIVHKLRRIKQMKGCLPNEANAIDYRKRLGHYLAAHVDDRKLSLEPIANLSLAGNCVMTFTNVAPANRSTTCVPIKRVKLKRRCLQVLTGKARYDFSHAIAKEDILSERRVSVTMRESPLTAPRHSDGNGSDQQSNFPKHWWKDTVKETVGPSLPLIPPSEQPIPGLFLYHDFITKEEEDVIMKDLDKNYEMKWKLEHHSGKHREKCFGVDHDLWSRHIRAPKHALPPSIQNIIIPKLKRLASMQGCIPNEANSIDYMRAQGDFLAAHVDDRSKHKEPVANLSLCGDCFMTYANQSKSRNLHITETKVLLKRRCLQVMTGNARYDFSHAIYNEDLLSSRRVSLTMRETNLKEL